MDAPEPCPLPSCCAGPDSCVFSKALLARSATCTLAQRQPIGEQEGIACPSPTARTHCQALLALMRERSTFALKLPRSGAPLMHARALQLQCGGIRALQEALGAAQADVHGLVAAAHAQRGSLGDLPWDEMVPAIAAWTARRPRQADPR